MTDTYGSQAAPPPWLDGSLPGDYSGFNPLGLSSDPDSLKWNVQAEFVHCRWAMLGADGIFIHEFLTKIGILNTPSWYTAGQIELFSCVPVLENFTEHLKRKFQCLCCVSS